MSEEKNWRIAAFEYAGSGSRYLPDEDLLITALEAMGKEIETKETSLMPAYEDLYERLTDIREKRKPTGQLDNPIVPKGLG